ncbi:glycosyl hydrolase [Mytilinidion resinicola]|uniref:Glycosyl hydrolase n=1 Tax=Mytilinidion resinicola TaxID=574789 RepID=A0A6A6Z1Y3_9PEZI|nr:glycosyl hydrolase [Mytilinidion resinicola]KAF2815111.1 glycosyl hydrolase [Mytilinidion resinicola]
MVKLGPDVSSGTEDPYSGYLPDGAFTGFSMMHESGTGGAPKYGVVSQMPVVGNVTNPLANLSTGRSSADEGSVGYYKASLASGVIVELAATEHAGLYEYSFPDGNSSSIVIDVSHVLPSYRGKGWSQSYSNGSFSIWEDNHYEGSGTYNGGWNLAPDWTIYFCGKFDAEPVSAKTFTGTGTTLDSYDSEPGVWTSGSYRQGGVFTFEEKNVKSRVGISFISYRKACVNLHDEIPSDTSLQTLVNSAKSKWNAEIFGKITTSSTKTSDLALLYTNLYGMNLIPSNRTDENPDWVSNEPYYDDIFTFWDLFRCSTALTHIIQPVAYEEQLRSIIDVWRHEGFLPDARSSNFNGRTQGGSNADNVLADAYVKGVRGSIDWQDGYSAMVRDAEKVPVNNHDPVSPDSSDKEGRGALPDWINYGYITPTYNRAVSRAVEYSANDFGLYQVAKGLGERSDASKYLKRSRNWRNHWNPNATSQGHSGFVAPRLANGSFIEQDPLSCGGCYWGDAYYQGLPWEYSMNAHHDVDTLIQYVGGEDRFVDRLDLMFQTGIISAGTIFNAANEPSFTTPYLYNFVGRQDLAVKRSRTVAKTYYNTGTGGIPGNSDAGAMQTWILWNMIGLYPLTGQTTFLIGSPWLSDMEIDLGTGNILNITSTGGNSDDAYYVQSLKVNGKSWDKAWVTWDDVFADGGSLEFELGEDPVLWATGPAPPSPASEAQ